VTSWFLLVGVFESLLTRSFLKLLSSALSAALIFRPGPRRNTQWRISIANRKGHAVNATFVDDAAKRISWNAMFIHFRGTCKSLRHRVT
jgi:hypothetical protein